MNNLPLHTQQVLSENRSFMLGDYISDGWDICKRDLGSFIGYFVISAFLAIMVSLFPYGIGNIGSLIIGGPLAVGFMVGAHAIRNDRSLVFSNFFDGFQRWQPLALSRLVISFFSVLLLLPLLFYVVHLLGGWQSIIDLVSEGDEQEQGRMMVALFKENFTPISFLIMGLLIIPVFVVSYLYTASFFFIWFYQLSFWDGMEASRMLVTRHFGMLLLFNLVWGLILSISAIPCGLGLLFTVPAYACSQYVAFAHLTGLNEVNPEIDDITEHFIAPQ